MILTASITPIEDCARPFTVGAELDAYLHLSVFHLICRRNRIDPVQRPPLDVTIEQSLGPSGLPDMTHLCAQIEELSRITYKGEPEVPVQEISRERTVLRVSDPLPVSLGFRQLQMGPSRIPTEKGAWVDAIGTLCCFEHSKHDTPVKVKVLDVLVLETDPGLPHFGEYVSCEVFKEGIVDVSNLNIPTVMAKLEVAELG